MGLAWSHDFNKPLAKIANVSLAQKFAYFGISVAC